MAWTETLPSGRYRAGYRIPGGTKRYLPGTYTHKRAALRAAESAEADTRATGWHDPEAGNRTWGEWADEWIPTRPVEASTARRDQSRLTKHLRPKWGATPLNQITRHAIKAWAAELQTKAELSPSSTQRAIALLSASLAGAVDAEIIPANPALRLRLGLQANPSERTLTRDEQHRLFSNLTNDFDRALVAVLLGTGARWGEAIALTAKRIDLEHGTIRYRDAWDATNRVLVPYTKGKQRRTVPLAPWLIEIIRPLVEATPTGYLFAGRGAAPFDYSSWHKRHWKPAAEAANLNPPGTDPATIHTLRHTYATEQLDAGLSLAEIATLLGHASIATTERYTHRSATVRAEAKTAVQDPRQAPATPNPPADDLPSNVIQFPRRA
ncbi:tyrosine-type recombinase/integrase [Leucobacter sp. HY1908]